MIFLQLIVECELGPAEEEENGGEAASAEGGGENEHAGSYIKQ